MRFRGLCLLIATFMHSARLTGRVYFFVKCAASGYFRLFDVSPASDGFLLCLALLCVLEVDNLERCLGKGIDGQVSVDLRRHGNRLVTRKILCNIKRDTGGLQVGRISMPQAVRREIVSHDGRFRVDCAACHLRAHIQIKRLLERAPHLLHGRFGVRSAGSRLRKKIAATLFLDLVPEIARGLYPDGVPLAIIGKRFAETSV